jgi:hypothetical protein
MSHILKNQDLKKHVDRYHTANLSVMQKTIEYDKKLSQLKTVKQNHKTEVANLKALCTSSINVLNFKLDEMTKKMKNEIYRLSEESRRHEESQKIENNKIQNQVNYIRENCDGLDKALKEILERVVNLETTLGPTNN